MSDLFSLATFFFRNSITTPVITNNAKLNPDETFTAYFGSREACGDVPNRLDVDKGWNFAMRIYRPGPSVIDRSYKLPHAVEIKQARSELAV